MHTLRVYRRCLGAHLRATLEYQADFWILVVAAVLTQGAGLLLIATIFARVPRIHGWGVWEVVLIFGMMVLAQGASELLAEGTWGLAGLINRGELDRMLLRPYPCLLQVCSSRVGMNAFGNLTVGGGLLGTALAHLDVAWTPGRVALAAVLLPSALLIKVSLTVVANSTSFWLRGAINTFAAGLDQLGELTKYPLSIYSVGLQAVLATALPFAFIGFFPVSAFLGHGRLAWVGLLTPVVAAWCVLLAVAVFRRGLRRYDSAGN